MSLAPLMFFQAVLRTRSHSAVRLDVRVAAFPFGASVQSTAASVSSENVDWDWSSGGGLLVASGFLALVSRVRKRGGALLDLNVIMESDAGV